MIWVFNIGSNAVTQIRFPALLLNPSNSGALLTETGQTILL